MIFGADVGVPLAPPSFASISQPLEKCTYFLAHPREGIYLRVSVLEAYGSWTRATRTSLRTPFGQSSQKSPSTHSGE